MKSFAKSKHPHSTKQVFVICHVMGKLFFVHSSKCVCVCVCVFLGLKKSSFIITSFIFNINSWKINFAITLPTQSCVGEGHLFISQFGEN